MMEPGSNVDPAFIQLQALANLYKQDPGASIGAWLLSVLICVWFSAILATQASTYYRTFTRDSRWLKVLVLVVVLASIGHLVTMIIVIWQLVITNYGNWIGTALTLSGWCVWLQPFFMEIELFSSQLFYVWRCYILMNRSKPILIGLLTGITAWAVLMTYTSVSILYLSHDPSGAEMLSRLTVPGLVIQLVTDILITGFSTWALLRTKSSFSNHHTQNLLRKLTIIVWEAAVPPVLVTLVDIPIWILLGHKNLIFVIFHTLGPKVYVYGLLFTLNSRVETRRWAEQESDQNKDVAFDSTKDKHVRLPPIGTETGTSIKFAVPSGIYTDVEMLTVNEDTKVALSFQNNSD